MKGCGVMPKEKINQARRMGSPVPETVLYESPVLHVSNDGPSLLVDPDTGTYLPDPATIPDESGPVYENGPVIQVGWHRDSWVQVSIEGDLNYFSFVANNPDGDTEGRSTAYSEPLTRDELNKLIRVLRRARDQAFGRDE